MATLVSKAVSGNSGQEAVPSILTAVLKRQGQGGRARQIDTGVMEKVVASWQAAIREGDRRQAQQLLSLAVTAKCFKSRHRHKFD